MDLAQTDALLARLRELVKDLEQIAADHQNSLRTFHAQIRDLERRRERLLKGEEEAG